MTYLEMDIIFFQDFSRSYINIPHLMIAFFPPTWYRVYRPKTYCKHSYDTNLSEINHNAYFV